MGIQINGNTNNINAGIGSLSIEDIRELDIIGVATASNFKTGISNLHNLGLTLTGGQLDVGSNIKLGNAGIVTASNFTSNGTVLIDTTIYSEASADGDDLIIGSTSDTQKGITIVGSTSGGVGNIFFSDGASYKNQGLIQYRHADDSMRFNVNQNERLHVTSNGQIGIGTVPVSGDQQRLTIHGDSNYVSGIRFKQAGASQYRIMVEGGTGHTYHDTYADGGDLIVRTNTAAGADEKLRITEEGQIGISETSPDTKLHLRNGVLKIETDTNFYSGSGENGENYASIFLNSNHSSGNNPAHGKITVRHSNQNTYSGDLVLMPQGYYGGSYGYEEVLRVSAHKRVGINEPAPSAELDVKGDGAPVNINSSNSNTFKIAFEDNGTVRGYIGCDNTNLLNVGNSSAASKFTVNTAGIAHNVDTSTHGSGVYMCEIHTDLLALLKSSQNHGNNTGMYYSWPDGGGASWSWDNGVLRMDSNIGSHSWQCGAVHLTPGYYTLMQCWRASPDAHGWSNFGSNSNGNGYYLTDDQAYGSYNTLLTSYAGQAPRNDGKTYWYGTTTGNFWHTVTSAGTYRIQQMGQPYGSGGYKYYILAAYLLKLK